MKVLLNPQFLEEEAKREAEVIAQQRAAQIAILSCEVSNDAILTGVKNNVS